jgi:hypothetical protein
MIGNVVELLVAEDPELRKRAETAIAALGPDVLCRSDVFSILLEKPELKRRAAMAIHRAKTKHEASPGVDETTPDGFLCPITTEVRTHARTVCHTSHSRHPTTHPDDAGAGYGA